jgi:hypothetical protein
MKRVMPWLIVLMMVAVAAVPPLRPARAAGQSSPPPDQRGRIDAERSGFHDAANIRTVFWNYGMVGDYPADPGNVDLSVFHSAEVPKGSGMNYSDGITPFVLAKIKQRNGDDAYIMETGFRERQGISPISNLTMRFEPRPGYFEADPNINRGRSPALSSDPRTWPSTWPNKVDDPDDPGWPGSWNGYFGKRPGADQESFTVMDDNYYDAWDFYPDSTDHSRRGLGLRVEVRGFQWANPQAGNVIFWHYDITNEGTTDYDDDIIFGLYMDSGVGGSALSCDGIFESDDDNAYFDRNAGLNLVYTWDKNGHGRDLSGPCGTTGYLGYAYLETPGNKFNGIDDDSDGIVDEQRDGGPGMEIVGKDAIRAYVYAHYDTTKFFATYGALDDRPAYRVGTWWTGDEDMDWRADVNDVGADGVKDTHDTGEDDGIPTEGEPNFDRTDLNESDQIGLTGFKMNRIRAGLGNPDQTTDGIVFFTDSQDWPQRLYQKFTNPFVPARFDSALASNYNIGFLFASGPFQLKAGKTERFSLALAYGADLAELRETVKVVQEIYNANYQFAVPPEMPTARAEAGDGYVRLSWDDVAERSLDPVSNAFDFEGYRIYRSTDPDFRDVKVLTTGRGNASTLNGKPIAQFDLIDGKRGYSDITVDGVAYYLGSETGITHTWTDTTVTNGQDYYYAVTSYDYGSPETIGDAFRFFPSENAIAVSRTPRGGTILPKNIVQVRPEPRVPGYEGALAGAASKISGDGTGTVTTRVIHSAEVPGDHLYKLTFSIPSTDSIHATSYTLKDSTTGDVFFSSGADFDGLGIGPVGGGILPIVTTPSQVGIGATSGYRPGFVTNTRLKASYQPGMDRNLRRKGYPDDISIVFDDTAVDTSLALFPLPAKPAKFRVVAHSDAGDIPLDFVFFDPDNNGTLSRADEYIDILTYDAPPATRFDITWHVVLDTLGQGARGPIVGPKLGDVYDLNVTRPLGPKDVFVFSTMAEKVDAAQAAATPLQPYVVPNPYVGAASFEPERYATNGRGERRIEFRDLPLNSVVRIYTVRGDLVQTLRQDGSTSGTVPWDLRTKDNLDVAPGLYIFHVEAPGARTHVGKFAVIK